MDLNCSSAETVWPYICCEVANWGIPFIALIAVIAFHVVTFQPLPDEPPKGPTQSEPRTEVSKEPRCDEAASMEKEGLLTRPEHRTLWLSAAVIVLLPQGYLHWIIMKQATIWVREAWEWDTKGDWQNQFFKPYATS